MILFIVPLNLIKGKCFKFLLKVYEGEGIGVKI
ncbi:hypothetical protein PAP_09790 [Palaeococcus pacificus DY20341]|uniref:Uncharacterized protein n=1 Tax=Palaeococcus pacificus DY20341 TaxID=1343739 RepID=A0A075M0N3_9EURY|nr:hypothetical protein PAP_09790 [Palaeococcus pacificus DY20341]